MSLIIPVPGFGDVGDAQSFFKYVMWYRRNHDRTTPFDRLIMDRLWYMAPALYRSVYGTDHSPLKYPAGSPDALRTVDKLLEHLMDKWKA